MPDIFEFWKDVGPTEKIHPADERVLVAHAKHSLALNCLPVPFYGPLKTAPVVLLALNPRLDQSDLADAEDRERQQFWFRQRQGRESLSSQTENPKAWWVSPTKCLGIDRKILRKRMAVLEFCPYHSKSFKDYRLLKELPSCQASLQWARDVLFPDARLGKKVVICLYAAKCWGLTQGTEAGYLFAPRTTYAIMRKKERMDSLARNNVIAAVQRILARTHIRSTQ